MSNRFVSLDLEMANDNISSICQVGVAVFEHGKLVNTWGTLVNPDGEFGYYQTKVHGLTKSDVLHAPKLVDISEHLSLLLADQVVCSYGMSDCSALMDSLPLPNCTWMDASVVARRVWEYGKNRRKLQDVCLEQNVFLADAHNALADAVATGELMCLAMQQKNFQLRNLLNFSRKVVIANQVKHVQTDLF